MPRNVRNFWIDAEIDGRSTRVATGPASKNGGFDLTIRQRDEGGIETAVTIHGFARDGILKLFVYDADGHCVLLKETRR